MKRATLPLLLCMVFFLVSRADAQESFRRFREGEWDTRLGASYFTSDTNYSQSGQTAKLLYDGKYQLTGIDLSSRYSITRDWAASAGVSGASATASSSLYGGHSASGLAGGWVGTEYRIAYGNVDFVPEVAFLFPSQQVSNNQSGAIFNEGVSGTLGNFFVQADFRSVRAFGSVGYLSRGGGRSSLAPWSAGLELPFSLSVIGVKLSGFESVSDDTDKGNTLAELSRSVTTNSVNGGSLKYYSINPALIDSDAYLMFNLASGFRAGFGGGATLSGSNQAQGYHAEVMLAFRFVPRALSQPTWTPPPRGSTPRTSIDPSRDRFSEDTEDGVDQKIFAPPPPPRPVPQLVVPQPQRQRRVVVPPSAPARPTARRPRIIVPPSAAEAPTPAPVEEDPVNNPGGYDVAPETNGFDTVPSSRSQSQPQQNFPDEQQRREEDEQQRVQKQLDDAEMQIELKVDKKRRR